MQHVWFEFGQFAQDTVRMPLEKRIVFESFIHRKRNRRALERNVSHRPGIARFGFFAGVNAQKRIAVFSGVSDESLAGHCDAVDFQKRIREKGDAQNFIHNCSPKEIAERIAKLNGGLKTRHARDTKITPQSF
jgi:hypothetical protein